MFVFLMHEMHDGQGKKYMYILLKNILISPLSDSYDVANDQLFVLNTRCDSLRKSLSVCIRESNESEPCL
jgi:hypothetical protein